MAKVKKVADWIDEIDAALVYREMFGREAAWKKLELTYINDPHGWAAVGPNLIYSMGDSLSSTLSVPDPEFVVTPERSSGVAKAPIIESLDASLVRKLELKRHVDMVIISGYLYGSMILKIGYDSEYGWAPYYDIGKGQNVVGMTMTQFDKRGHRIESPDIQPGWPWIRPVLPHDFVVPWGTVWLPDAPWAAHRIVRHIDSIRADPKYKNTSNLEPQISMADFMESYLTTGTRKQRARLKGIARFNKKPEYVELWEIRDRLTGEILVVNRNHNKFLRKAPDFIQRAIGMPFVHGTLNQHPRSFWSTPPAYYLGQIQKTQFDISLQAEKQRRISILKFLFRSGAIDKEKLSRLISGDVGAAEGVDTTFPLNDIIAPINTGTSPWDAVAQSENSRRDAREAIGFSRNQLGEFDTSSRRTAREATFVAQGSQRRTTKREGVISKLYIDCIRKVNDLIFDFWTTPRDVLVDDRWVNVTGTSLRGQYDYDVNLVTKRAVSRAERKIEAIMLMGQLSQIPGIDIEALKQYIIDASGDPAFENILRTSLAVPPSAEGGRASTSGLPTIPATGR